MLIKENREEHYECGDWKTYTYKDFINSNKVAQRDTCTLELQAV